MSQSEPNDLFGGSDPNTHTRLQSLRPLKQHFFDAYGGFADKRVKDLDKRNTFIVDERDGGHAIGSDGGLYGSFCALSASVVGANTIELTLYGCVPMSPEIEGWAASCEATIAHQPGVTSLRVTLCLGQERRLLSLADLLMKIVRPGSRYKVAAYKYACPRTARALRRLAAVMRDAHRANNTAAD